MSSPGWSIGNAYQQNNEGAWSDISSGKSIRIALHAETAPNKEPAGIPVVTGTARVGKDVDRHGRATLLTRTDCPPRSRTSGSGTPQKACSRQKSAPTQTSTR